MTTDERIERIQHVMNSIEPGKVTLLTGSNGSGKSLVRKQIRFRLSRKIPGSNPAKLTADVSMQRRTESNVGLGALCCIMHDDADTPTSCSTYNLIKTMMDTFLKEDNSKRYLIIDEPEIGMSKESQLGLMQYLSTKIDDVLKYTHGLLIITHSDVIVNALKDKAVFLNMDTDYTVDEWLNRKIVPVDLEQLEKESDDLYRAINNYSKK